MSADPFAELAATYDLPARGREARREFFRSLIERWQIKSVLDCACGTGDDLLLLHELGGQVQGSDISAAMLDVARRKVAQAGYDIPLQRADFRNLPAHHEHPFDAVVCLTTSLPQLPDETQVGLALKSMHDILKPGGVLLLSQGLSDKQYRERVRFVPILETAEHTRLLQIEYNPKSWGVHLLDFDRREPEPSWKVHHFHYVLLLHDDYLRLLGAAGFMDIEAYDGFSQKPYDRQKSDGLVILARR